MQTETYELLMQKLKRESHSVMFSMYRMLVMFKLDELDRPKELHSSL